jgi:hypothetical protein
MGVVKLSTAGILDYSKTSNFLSGNAPLSLGSFNLLETTTLSTNTSSVTFSGIDQSYKHLQIRMIGRGEADGSIFVRLNNDSGANYARHRIMGNGNSLFPGGYANQSGGYRITNGLPDDTSLTNEFGPAVIDILDFASPNKNTTLRALSGAASDYYNIQLSSGLWIDTAAVTTIMVYSGTQFSARSRISLYGVK